MVMEIWVHTILISGANSELPIGKKEKKKKREKREIDPP